MVIFDIYVIGAIPNCFLTPDEKVMSTGNRTRVAHVEAVRSNHSGYNPFKYTTAYKIQLKQKSGGKKEITTVKSPAQAPLGGLGRRIVHGHGGGGAS